MVPVETLKKLDVFDDLTKAELEAIQGIAQIEDFPRGTVIFNENEDAKNLFVLLQGNVAIQFEVGRNRRVTVHSVSSGQAFGWSALVQPYRFTASAKCVNKCQVVAVDRDGIRKLIEMDCHMGFVIMEKLAGLVSERLRDTRMQLISMLHG